MATRRALSAALLAVLGTSSLAAQERAPRTAPPPAPGAPFPSAAPLGLPPIPQPADNPLTPEGFELGQALFFDPILSIDHSVSCGSCHRPDSSYASPEPLPAGAGTRRALRHSPTLLNRAYGRSQRWDGRNPTLEQQVLQPIADPNEMGLPLEDAISRLRAHAVYPRRFEEVFGTAPSEATLGRALASFVRGLVQGDTPVDRFIAGRRNALTVEERAGMWVYESVGRCWRCHTQPNFSDEDFHSTGIGVTDGVAEPGRMAVTGDPADRGRFKTPTLRGLLHSAPYMHDGSLATLEDVVAFYRRGGNPHDTLSPKIEPLAISDSQARHLVAFLEALSRSGELPAAK